MKSSFSPEVKETISLSLEEATRLNSDCIGSGHLLLGLIRQEYNSAVDILNELRIDLPAFKKEIEMGIQEERKTRHDVPEKTGIFRFFHKTQRGLFLDRPAERAIRESVAEAGAARSGAVNSEHLMLSLLKNQEYKEAMILNRFGLDYNKFAMRVRRNRPY